MKSGQKGRQGSQRKGKGHGKPDRMQLASHRAFAPLLGLWGALLGGLAIMVMPYSLIGDMLDNTLIGSWGETAQVVLAAILATLAGSVTFAFGALRHSQASRRPMPSMVKMARRQITPIDPANDLGSRRLDDPVEAMPFTTPAWHDADLEDPRRAPAFADTRPDVRAAPVGQPDPVTEPERGPEPEPAPAAMALDLAQFDEWSAEDTAPVSPEPVAAQPAASLKSVKPVAAPMPGTAALARLRALPPTELSLAEMVERFAAALHEHRESQPGVHLGPADLAAREAALAEALKALAALSGGPAAESRNLEKGEPLRAAIAQLQSRRGAA